MHQNEKQHLLHSYFKTNKKKKDARTKELRKVENMWI
jgi:hypothetical protein